MAIETNELARMIEWVTSNPEAAARELIEMEKRISQAERLVAMEEQHARATREENARLRELIGPGRPGGVEPV